MKKEVSKNNQRRLVANNSKLRNKRSHLTKGKEKLSEEIIKKFALTMLKKGLTPEAISKRTNLSVEEINKMKNTIF